MYKYVAKYLMLEKVYKFCEVTSFPSLLIGLVLFALGAFQALFIASADVQQDEVYRIIYIHVPSAILSELIYIFLAICGLIFLVWKTKISTIFLNPAVPMNCINIVSFNYRLIVGEANMGDLLGLGCKNYVNFYTFASIYRVVRP